MGIIPEVFDLDDQDYLHVLQDEVTPENEQQIREAVRQCPRQAISFATSDTQPDRFIFVHGGFHAAWCWERTIAELEGSARASPSTGSGNGECDVSIVNCSTPRRRVTVSASHCGID